jgi:hypothetical protein
LLTEEWRTLISFHPFGAGLSSYCRAIHQPWKIEATIGSCRSALRTPKVEIHLPIISFILISFRTKKVKTFH